MTVFVAAVVLRVGWVMVRHAEQPNTLNFPDEQAYMLAARSLASGGGLIDEFGFRATDMPGYPAFLAAFDALRCPLLVIRTVQAVLGALVALAVFALARSWMRLAMPQARQGWADRVGLIAGLMAAVDPFLLFFSGLLLTETLFAVALVAFWWMAMLLADDRRTDWLGASIGAGVCLFIAVMLRPSATILLVVAPIAIITYRRFAGRSFASSGIVVAVVLAGLLPWAKRNDDVLGEWRWTTTRGGISLYDGVQPGATGASDLAHTKTDPTVADLSEVAWDRHWHDLAIMAIREHPGRIVRLAGCKFLRFWNIIPNEENSRRGTTAIISAAWVSFVLLAAGMGLWRLRRSIGAVLLLVTPVVAFTLIHMVYVGSVRYRIPVMPMLFVLAAAGLASFGRDRSTGESAS